MKYIRTKNGIFDRINELLIFASQPPKYELRKNGELIGYEFCHKCRLAEDIETLFDCFVIILNGKPIIIEKDKQYAFYGGRMSGKASAISEPFGAIWIFNENKVPELKCIAQKRKGEWELL